MAQIIKFPVKPQDQWSQIEEIIRRQLTMVPEDGLRFVIEHLKNIYDRLPKKFDFQFSLPGDFSAADLQRIEETIHKTISEQVIPLIHSYSNQALLELMMLEIEIWRLNQAAEKT